MDKFSNVWVPTLQGAFLTKYEGGIGGNWSTSVTRKYDVSGEFFKPVDIGTVGAVRQFSGKRHYTDPNVYTLTQQNLPYELSMKIDIESVNRDYLGMFESKAAEMGGKFADHVNKLVISNITSNPNCFDGVTYFNTAHPVGKNTQANDLSSSQVASLDVATAAAPTAVEMSNAILDVVSYSYTLVDEAGDPVNGGAKEFMIATSNPRIYSSAIAAIASMQLSQGQTNPLYAGLEAKGYKFQAVLEPRLGAANDTKFYVFRTDSEVKPFIWGEEKGLTINYLGEGSFNAVNDNVYIWAAKAVRSVGVGRYQYAFKCTLS